MRDTKVILAAITLDMFAVLFGGAVALLPIYATDILHVGPQGMGMMRAAPSIGALLMAFLIAHLPPMKNAGRTLLLGCGRFWRIHDHLRTFNLVLALGADACAVGRPR